MQIQRIAKSAEFIFCLPQSLKHSSFSLFSLSISPYFSLFLLRFPPPVVSRIHQFLIILPSCAIVHIGQSAMETALLPYLPEKFGNIRMNGRPKRQPKKEHDERRQDELKGNARKILRMQGRGTSDFRPMLHEMGIISNAPVYSHRFFFWNSM